MQRVCAPFLCALVICIALSGGGVGLPDPGRGGPAAAFASVLGAASSSDTAHATVRGTRTTSLPLAKHAVTPPPVVHMTPTGETIRVPLNKGTSGVRTAKSYSGTVTLTVSGTGQADGCRYSDAFYIFADCSRTPFNRPLHYGHPMGTVRPGISRDELPFDRRRNPTLRYDWTLWINGQPSDAYVSTTPAYSNTHRYIFTITAPGGRLTFAVGDPNPCENTGYFSVTLAPGKPRTAGPAGVNARGAIAMPSTAVSDGRLQGYPCVTDDVVSLSSGNFQYQGPPLADFPTWNTQTPSDATLKCYGLPSRPSNPALEEQWAAAMSTAHCWVLPGNLTTIDAKEFTGPTGSRGCGSMDQVPPHMNMAEPPPVSPAAGTLYDWSGYGTDPYSPTEVLGSWSIPVQSASHGSSGDVEEPWVGIGGTHSGEQFWRNGTLTVGGSECDNPDHSCRSMGYSAYFEQDSPNRQDQAMILAGPSPSAGDTIVAYTRLLRTSYGSVAVFGWINETSGALTVSAQLDPANFDNLTTAQAAEWVAEDYPCAGACDSSGKVVHDNAVPVQFLAPLYAINGVGTSQDWTQLANKRYLVGAACVVNVLLPSALDPAGGFTVEPADTSTQCIDRPIGSTAVGAGGTGTRSSGTGVGGSGSAQPGNAVVGLTGYANPSTGLTLSGTTGDGSQSVTVYIPPGAVSSETLITITPVSYPGASGDPNTQSLGDSAFDITATDASGNKVTQFSQPIWITLSYPSDIPNEDTARIVVTFYDTSTGKWVTVPGPYIVNTADHTITFETNHLTVYGLFMSMITPIIDWATPADIVYGAALGSTELDATASVLGSLSYIPQAGTVLLVGKGQTLSVGFTPDDPIGYANSRASVNINVKPARLVIRPDDHTMIYGGLIPTFGVSATGYKGLVNMDAPSVVNGLVCTAMTRHKILVSSSTPVGNYKIICSGGKSANYRISYRPGTLTIVAGGAAGTGTTSTPELPSGTLSALAACVLAGLSWRARRRRA